MAKIAAIHVPLKDAEKVKKILLKNGLFLAGYPFLKDENLAKIPIKDKDKIKDFEELAIYDIKYIEVSKQKDKKDFKTLLTEVLTEEELSKVKTAFDSIGAIAILEIDDSLNKKQKLIAEALLKSSTSIRTVLKKDSAHEGEFRTQKMKWLAGEKTKIATHKENNITMHIDVEKVYFSPRLSTDRKRIVQMVKPGEDILVMFSGAAPYPCVLAKNTEARSIFGVEINPEGHKYGMQNVRLNKLHNVTLINGDVRKVVPDIYRHIIGLKSSDRKDELQSRLNHHPVLMELHLFDEDLKKDRQKLLKTIEKLQSKGIHVVLHMPFMQSDGKRYSLGQSDIPEETKMLTALGEICKQYHIKAVVHPTQDIGVAENEDMLVANIKKFKKYFDHFYFENAIHGIFAKTGDIIRIGKKAGIKNTCIDICHLFIIYEDSDRIESHIKRVRKYFRTYFHLNDHDYKTHSCEIGKGKVDFTKVLPYVNQGITEICNKDEKRPVEMISSYRKINGERRLFDRILMPLPKTADQFLDVAIAASKKGTTIHFYDFMQEDEFHLSHKKIADACKKAGAKHRIIETVKCGQHAPHVFRICVDFIIL